MASERDFELLDDYIGNRLSEAEKNTFESKLQADPELARELKLQQGIVDSLRKARAAELKSMLNNIPPAEIPSQTSSLAKWTGIAVAIIVALGLYFYLKPEQESRVTSKTDTVTVAPPASDQTKPEGKSETETSSSQDNAPDDQPSTDRDSKVTTPSAKQKPAPAVDETQGKAKAPEIDVFDPADEPTAESKAPSEAENAATAAGTATTSDIASEIVTNNKNYTFHYQFKDDKLVLYGAFDKSLYEILEFIADNKRTIFLHYKNNFYLLNQAGEKVKPLSPVNDPVLIQKLREHLGE
jgi:hypothetical protein